MCCRSFCAGLALPGLVSDGVRYSRHLFGGGGDRAAPQSGDYDPLLDECFEAALVLRGEDDGALDGQAPLVVHIALPLADAERITTKNHDG